ncbi:MAG: lytic transglycosylase domain-containing protein [Solirubrobacteraceae bacterium]
MIVRRRIALLLGVASIAAVLTALTLPMLKEGVKEFTLPLRHEDIIRQQAAEKDLDPALIAGVIYAESKFTDATSHAGALGLMQITPDTAKYIAQISGATNFQLDDLSNPDINIRYGAYYLQYLLDRYDDNIVLALAAYNAGGGNVDKWLEEGRTRVRDIPFPETREYVKRVIDARGAYSREYRDELGL